jgi:hypothetical protein
LKGEDDSGNIKNVQNILHLTNAFIRRVHPSKDSSNESTSSPNGYCMADLVTADGSVDSQYDANAQEIITASLHLAEYCDCLQFSSLYNKYIF